METIFDWITVAIFAGLITLFLQRSKDAEPRDPLWHYFVASAGCAITNFVGNESEPILAVILLVGLLAFIWLVLRPFDGWTPGR